MIELINKRNHKLEPQQAVKTEVKLDAPQLLSRSSIVRYDPNDLRLQLDKLSLVGFHGSRPRPARTLSRCGASSGTPGWLSGTLASRSRRSPCTPALLRATDGDESTRRPASSFLVASGRGCYTLSVRSTTPN